MRTPGLRKFLITESPWKMLKNPYFTLKALFVPKIFKFLPWPFGHIEKWLIRKIRLISKFMTSQPGKQTIAIHILSNISRSKSNRTMKFGQLIECNMRNIFLKTRLRNVLKRLFPNPFLKNQNWAYPWINSLYSLYSFFITFYSIGLLKYIKTKPQTTCFYLI